MLPLSLSQGTLHLCRSPLEVPTGLHAAGREISQIAPAAASHIVAASADAATMGADDYGVVAVTSAVGIAAYAAAVASAPDTLGLPVASAAAAGDWAGSEPSSYENEALTLGLRELGSFCHDVVVEAASVVCC